LAFEKRITAPYEMNSMAMGIVRSRRESNGECESAVK